MDCIQTGICNCLSDCKCDPGYQCCSQEVPKGKATYGMCVKAGHCDSKRGIPLKSCKNTNKEQTQTRKEFFQIISQENYTYSKNWKKPVVITSCIVGLLLLGIVYQRKFHY